MHVFVCNFSLRIEYIKELSSIIVVYRMVESYTVYCTNRLQPCEIILNHTHPPLLSPVISDHHRKLHIVGNLLAAVIFHGDNVDFNLTVPLTKQVPHVWN